MFLVTVGDISLSIDYGYTASSTSQDTGVRFLRITDIQNNKVDWDDVPFCRIDKSIIEKFSLVDGDIVFARTGATVGKSYLIKGKIPTSVFYNTISNLLLFSFLRFEIIIFLNVY